MKPVAGGKFLTAGRGKPGPLGQGNASSGALVFRVTDRAGPAVGHPYGQAVIGPAPNDPALLEPVDAMLDASGALFVGYFSNSLAGRQNFRIAKYLPIQGQQQVVTPEFDVLSRDQAIGRSVVPDDQGGVFVRGFVWDPTHDVQKAVPYTRRFSANGELMWEKLGVVMPRMAAAAFTERPLVLLGVGDGNGGLFEVQNIAGVTPKNNFDATSDRARIVHRRADGSVEYDRIVALSLGAMVLSVPTPTPGGVVKIFRGPQQRPILVFQSNADPSKRRILDVDANGKTRVVATFSDLDHVLQAADGGVVIVSDPSPSSPRMKFTQIGMRDGKLQITATTATPDIPGEKWAIAEDDAHVSLSANGVVVVATSERVEGRLAAATLAGKFIGAAKSPGGTDMLVNDGKHWFGYSIDGGWAYKGGAIDLGYSPPAIQLPH